MYSTPDYSNNKNYKNYKTIDRIHKIEYIKGVIQDLENYGPAGLIHIAILSDIIQRSIKIWNANGSLNKIIGKRKTGHPIDIEYQAISSKGIGHWTLRGGKDPDNVIIDLNSCLFSVIGSQIGQNPLKLRKWTQLKLKANFQNLTKWIDKILQLEGNDKIILMIGGACYNGTTPYDAGMIIDLSQGRRGHGFSNFHHSYGHARGHASFHTGCGLTDRIEEYSSEYPKSGFLSRDDMNYVAHLALCTEEAQKAILKLNNGLKQDTLHISVDDIEKQRILEGYENCPLPEVKEWCFKEPKPQLHKFQQVVLTLGHYENKMLSREENVWICTFYPVIATSLDV